MGIPLPRIEILGEYIARGLSLERAYEEGAMWEVYKMLPEEGLEEVKQLMFEMSVRSQDHFYTITEITDEVGLKIDADTIDFQEYGQGLVERDPGFMGSESHRPVSVDSEVDEVNILTALQDLKRHEMLAKQFYTRLAGSVRKSEFQGIDTEGLAETFERLAKEEGAHMRRYDDILQDLEEKRSATGRLKIQDGL